MLRFYLHLKFLFYINNYYLQRNWPRLSLRKFCRSSIYVVTTIIKFSNKPIQILFNFLRRTSVDFCKVIWGPLLRIAALYLYTIRWLWNADTVLCTKEIRSTIAFICSFHSVMYFFHSFILFFHSVMNSFHLFIRSFPLVMRSLNFVMWSFH